MSALRHAIRSVKPLLRSTAIVAGMPVTVLAAAFVAAINLRRLLRADAIVVMEDGGFGHTVVGPDVIRRLYPNGRCVFVYFDDYGRYNRRVGALWPDVETLALPSNLGTRLAGRVFTHPVSAAFKLKKVNALIWMLRKMTNATVQTLREAYACLPPADDVAPVASTEAATDVLIIRYFRLQNGQPAPPIRVPAPLRQQVDAALVRAAGRRMRRCGLYLRQRDTTDVRAARRNGSALETYLPAVRVLNEAGYQVLLTGDARLGGTHLPGVPAGLFVDAPSLQIEDDLFGVYAAVEVDVFVGESGGGLWLPGVNRIPRLVINAFPYALGVPNGLMYYKTVKDARGRLVPWRILFEEHAFDYHMDGWTVIANTAAELGEAAAEFVDRLRPADSPDDRATVGSLPGDVWVPHTGARVSHAWLRRHALENARETGADDTAFVPLRAKA